MRDRFLRRIIEGAFATKEVSEFQRRIWQKLKSEFKVR